MKEQNSIPATKVERAAKFIKTGVKIGTNYVKHYALKAVNQARTQEDLHQDNAEDIYKTLSELKGSALKVAQMMSMDKNLLPKAYSEKFQMAQYAAPPLSYPLVVKTFQKYFHKSPTEIFDSFTKEAVNAASIGQVHQATKNGKKFAVKIQYPGVADSIRSDLKIVKPFAINLLQLNEKEVDLYIEEVETMLLSETDYELELKRSIELSEACKHIPNIYFPKYYPEYSCKRILTMDWLEGMHLDKFLAANPSQEICNQIGQALWDFYDFQIHTLRAVHADPHPGNFILSLDGKLGIIDFGCVKIIPSPYYEQYFTLMDKDIIINRAKMEKTFKALNFIYDDDSQEEQNVLFEIFSQMTALLGKPFYDGKFDFGNQEYFQEVFAFGEEVSKNPIMKNSKKPRGVKDALYINRTYFGLYSILNQLKANISTYSRWYEKSF
ncbi:MAG: AarF/ABC1/UbiB kinase family protein [Cytophagales bacterium]|nr:AarF/ABC1/UbiB kinase family protein [Cytophagales bacterium]MDW8383513.1 AarF/ABC1/UbiB kinase family protein [Flammeovirgaceae bacterium]